MESELGIARGHLQGCQLDLRAARAHRVIVDGSPRYDFIARDQAMMAVRSATIQVLAALSWLWDAQQREIMREGEDALFALLRDHNILVLPPKAYAALRRA